MRKAYALRDEFAGTVQQVIGGTADDPETVEVPVYGGGVVAVGDDGRPFDVRKALDDGDGIIVTDEPALQLVLDHYAALEPVDVPADADATTVTGALTVKDLREEVKRRGLVGGGKASKDALIIALAEHDRRLADGDTTIGQGSTVRVGKDGDLTVEQAAPGAEPAQGVNADDAAAEPAQGVNADDAAAADAGTTTTTTTAE